MLITYIKNNVIETDYHIYFSEQLSYDFLFVGNYFSNFIKNLNLLKFKNFNLWTDGRNYFKS